MLSMRRVLFVVAAAFAAVGGACDCSPPVPPPPELEIIGTGFFVGQVYVDGETISGATVEIAGLATRAITESGKQFTLYPVPVGEHTITIREETTGRARRFKASIATANQTVVLPEADTTLLEPVTISGRVDAGADGAAGATVFVVGGTSEEIENAGDDGSFTLRNVPPGALTIGASKAGFDLARVEVVADAGEQHVLPEDIVLVPLEDPNAKTTVSGNVTAADRTDHAGTIIIVDGGEEVTTTNSNGDFEIDVVPGHHEFVAERPGHEPVTLPTAGTDEEGNVEGVVDMFVAPGDEGGGDVVVVAEGAALNIELPAAGASVVVGVPALFTVNAEGVAADDVTRIVWSVAPIDDPGAGVSLGNGLVLSAVVPIDFADEQLVVTASLPGAGLVDAVAVVGAPLFAPDVRLGVDGALVARPVIAPDPGDGVLRVDIAEGHPVLVVAESAVPGTILWSEGNTPLGTDVLDLGQLEVGTHLTTATVSDGAGEGGTATLDLRVVVAPFVFEAIVEEPTAGVTYFTDQPLPLRASFVHPWQLSFPAQAVRWSDLDGDQLGVGLVTSTRSAPQDEQLVQLEMTDVVGNRAATFADYLYTPINFTATFNAPANNVTFLEADDVTFNISFSHPTLAADDAVVTLSSSIQGQLSDVNGAVQFAPNSDIVVSELVPGTHQVTARVLGQGRVASVTQTLVIDADFVTANLQVPASVLALDGVSMEFEVVVGATPGITPRVTWLVDGVPFVNAWDLDGDYNAANPQAPGNTVVDLGTYDANTPPLAFNDPAWGPGVHTVQAWVRLPNDPDAEANGCVNNGSISRCLSFALTVFDSLQERGGSGDVTLTAADPPEVWEGGILLKASYFIDGGTLIIQPGTTVVIDMADRNNPAVQNASSNRIIQVSDGTLQVGAPGGVPPVRFEVRRAFIPQNNWQGIRTNNQTAGVPRTISLQNVVIADAVNAFHGTFGSSTLAPNNSLILEDITVERSSSTAFILSCPASFARITVRNSVDGMTLSDDALCPNAWGIDGAVFENTNGAIALSTGRRDRITLSNLSVSGTTSGTDVNVSGPMDLVVSDSRFERFNHALRYGAVPNASGDAGSLRLERNTFSDGNLAFQLASNTGTSIAIVDNTFERSQTALQLFALSEDDVDIHVNRFLQNDRDMQLFGAASADIDGQGNFFGDPGDDSTGAGRMAQVDAGNVVNLPTIIDGFDGQATAVIRVDNPLETAEAPRAIIYEPAHMASYNPNLCLPLVARAPRDDDDSVFDPDNDCTWSLFSLGADPSSGTPLTPAGLDRCANEDVAPGDYGIALTCVSPDTGETTTHTSRVHISDADVFAGRITAPGFTLTGDVLVDGDLIVDEGATLTIAAGTTVRFAIEDRSQHDEPLRGGSGRAGDDEKPDIVVRGALQVAGSAAAPVVLRSDVAQDSGLWGGIVAEPNATVVVDHAVVESAGVFLLGQEAVDAFAAPSISVRNVDAVALTSFIGGDAGGRDSTCPSVVADTTVTFVEGSVVVCAMATNLSVERSSFDDVRSPGHALELRPYAGTLPSLSVVDSSFSATANAQVAMSLSQETTSFVRSSIDGWGTLFSYGNTRLTIADSTFENYSDTAFSAGGEAVTQIDRSIFRNAPSVAEGTLSIFVLRDSLIEDVSVPFGAVQTTQVDAVTITGNEVRGAQTIFDIRSFFGVPGIASWNVTANNFTGTTAAVVDISGDVSSFITRIDLDGSFFGTGNDTVAEIGALIDDPRTDANANDTVEGNTDFTGFLTAPLPLDLP